MNREELQKRYQKGRKNFAGLNLSGLNLVAIQMPCADLSCSNLSNADLRLVNLEVANLSQANLSGAKLMNSKLTEANLYRADLRSVSMNSVTLGKANLEEANLEGANLFFTRLSKTNLSGANLKNVNWRNSFLYKVVLRNADLTGADLTGTNLQGSDLTGANLTDAKLDGVCWLEVQLDDPDTLPEKDALIWRISNQGVEDLRGIDLSNSDLRQVDLQNLDLSEINFSKTNLLQANLAGANLAGANLARANLTQANLTNVNLVSVRLYKTDFRSANLQGIQFNGTSFLNSNLIDAVNVPSDILSTSVLPTKHPDIDLVNSISTATEGLICHSEKGDPYEIFLWDTTSKGEFTLEKLLRAMAHLKLTNLNDLQHINLHTEQVVRAYEVLLNTIQTHLVEIELYEFTTESLHDSSSVMPCIVIGRTVVGDWFGITTKTSLKVDIKTSEAFYTEDGAQRKVENQRLISLVQEIAPQVNEVLPNSEGTEGIIWALATSRDLMIQNLLLKTKHFAIKDVRGCEYLFQQGISDDTEQRELFAQLVLNNLNNLRVYFVGAANVDLYLVGQTQSQDWLGIHTGVTWT